jgi:carbonic anhydrase
VKFPAAEPSVVTRHVTPTPTDPHWSYEGEAGPSAWGGLGPKFSACAGGRNQFPIDITGASSKALPGLTASFRPAALRIVHHESR